MSGDYIPQPGDCITSTKHTTPTSLKKQNNETPQCNHPTYSFSKTDKAHYTYAALVTKVVDGDTLWAAADLGFGVKHRLKLRLRGINTAELGILSRGEAKRYVEKRTLGKQVVIRTYQEDKYGRYLADIYYLKGKEKEGTKKGEETDPHKIAEKGNFLNQELLDEELAEVYI